MIEIVNKNACRPCLCDKRRMLASLPGMSILAVPDIQISRQKHGLSWIETQFLIAGFNALSRCRTTLMYTYVFAYYLEKNPQAEIFEGNQAVWQRQCRMRFVYIETQKYRMEV
jgi:hypothetical protein